MKKCKTALCILIVSLLTSIGETTARVSPFDYSNYYSPACLFRMSYSATLAGSSITFTVTLPKALSAVPIVLYSISSLTFSRGIKYSFNITTVTNSAITAIFQFNSTITKASFLFLALDSKLYSATLTYFTYNMPVGTNGPQTINITGNQLHDASYLVAFQSTVGPFSAGYAPEVDSVILVDTSSIISAQLSFVYDPSQLAINSLTMLFVDFQISSFKAAAYAGVGQQFAIYGTNGISTDTTQTGSTYYSFVNNYFPGLQAIYDGQFLFGTLSFDIIAMLNTNVYYFISELLLVAYRCPASFPYTVPARNYCYSDCQVGFYSDNQYMCQPCNANCYTCYNMSTNCTSCVSPYVLVYGFRCACIETSFQVVLLGGSSTCQPCSIISGCFTCTSATNCLSCMNNLVRISPLICSCPVGTVWTNVGSTDIICVQLTSTVLTMNEVCPVAGMVANLATCTCPSEQNMTLVNGVCS